VLAVIVSTARILTITATASSEQAKPSSTTNGTASIAWVEGSSSGGGDNNVGGGGSGGSGGGGSSSDGSGNSSGHTTINIGREPSLEIVSIPNPNISLGRLPETGRNYFIPLTLISVGMFLLLVYAARGKGRGHGYESVDIST